ncbi:hypothetical protein [Pectinatus frisingensis]|uniref:hypothetical protein n=1 Tax=Pectinatus frisingensis TaxID=865 RepID=UPI0018C6CEDC|nr:hypothetical protein [Pectinatus frisingensis]
MLRKLNKQPLLLTAFRNARGEIQKTPIKSIGKSGESQDWVKYGQSQSFYYQNNISNIGFLTYTMNGNENNNFIKYVPVGDDYYEAQDGYYVFSARTSTYQRLSNFVLRVKTKISEVNIIGNESCKYLFEILKNDSVNTVSISVENIKNLISEIERNFPDMFLMTDKIKNAKECFKHIISILIGKPIPAKTYFTYFGWSPIHDGRRTFLHGGLEICNSDKKLPELTNANIDVIRRNLCQIFNIATDNIILPLFVYQGEAFMDAIFSDAGYQLQNSLMAIAKTGSFKTQLFKVIFAPFSPANEKIYTIRSSMASLNILHERCFDDVFVNDDFNVEGSQQETNSLKSKIWNLVRAYSDKTPRAKYAGFNQISQNALRGGCVFTAEEELSGEITSSTMRYIKVYFETRPNAEILSFFQVHPEILRNFWAVFIMYLEKNYIKIMEQVKHEFPEFRKKYENKFSHARLADIGIHAIICAQNIKNVFIDTGIMQHETASAWIVNFEDVIMNMLERQDRDSRHDTPEVQYIKAIFDMINDGNLKIADKIDYYVENLANFDGYKTNNDIFLKNHQTYTKIITYYEKVRGYYGTSLRATNKLLKKLNLVDHDNTGCLKRASDRIPNRPRMLALKVDMCVKLINGGNNYEQ